MDSDDKTSSVLNAFSSIFKGGSIANIFSDIATSDNKPIIQFLDNIINTVRGGALPYENLVSKGSALQYFLNSDVGKKMLPNYNVSKDILNGEVNVEEAKRLIKSLEKELKWKESIGGKLDLINRESDPEKKI